MNKRKTSLHKNELKRLLKMRDEDIDTSDIPELTEEQFRTGVRGLLYRPIKKPVTMRLDADIIEWLKSEGRGYQTKANALLRREMMHSYQQKKNPAPQAESSVRHRKRK